MYFLPSRYNNNVNNMNPRGPMIYWRLIRATLSNPTRVKVPNLQVQGGGAVMVGGTRGTHLPQAAGAGGGADPPRPRPVPGRRRQHHRIHRLTTSPTSRMTSSCPCSRLFTVCRARRSIASDVLRCAGASRRWWGHGCATPCHA